MKPETSPLCNPENFPSRKAEALTSRTPEVLPSRKAEASASRTPKTSPLCKPEVFPFCKLEVFPFCKLEIFLPETHLESVRAALQAVDAGHIGNYDSCLSYSPVTGCWRPLDGTSPYLGRTGEVSSEPELKVEVTCPTERVRETVEAVKRVHPYEEPVINVIPLLGTGL